MIHLTRVDSLQAIVLAVCLLAAQALSAAEHDAPETLPLHKVVLFTSGVGYYEHQQEIDGEAAFDLKFDVDDINDLLKSIVVEDRGGGRVKAITYPAHEPIERTLTAFSIDLAARPTIGELLGQLRGERVKIDAASPTSGVILGVERREEATEKGDVVRQEWLNLVTERGLRSLALERIAAIELADASLNEELHQALAVLAAGRRSETKTVSLRFGGEGRRNVRVGYVRESPVWKASYRLMLGDENKAHLQGWAIVENTSEQDWQSVRLSLVSGRPVSFVMNLYDPLYVARPVIQPDLYGSVAPALYEQDMTGGARGFLLRRRPDQSAPATGGGGGLGGGGGGFFGGGAGLRSGGGDAATEEDEPLDPTRGVSSIAAGEDIGELFHYEIKVPVTIGRRKSALLPIVNDAVEAEKVCIYNQANHEKHPLAGLRLTNSTKLHLMRGPATVFDGGAYAGDARLPDLTPGGERLISYALDLETEVVAEAEDLPRTVTSVQVRRGVFRAALRQQRERRYTIKNSAEMAKKILIEHPRSEGWSLVETLTPEETTRSFHRFAVDVEPGQTALLTVATEQTTRESHTIANTDARAFDYYLQVDAVDTRMKDALRELARRRGEIAALTKQAQLLKADVDRVHVEQARVRENMKVLDRTTELYRRYVSKFAAQESEIETVLDRADALLDEAAQKEQLLDAFIGELDLP